MPTSTHVTHFYAGLITAELLANASKYAHPAGLPVKIHVHCETGDDGSFVVEVTDDGVGFPENFDPCTDGGRGFQLMRALANGLNAELQFQHDSLGVFAFSNQSMWPRSAPDCVLEIDMRVRRINMASIVPFIRNAGIVFDRVTQIIGEAFDGVRKDLHDTGKPAIVYGVIAKRILDAAKRGERNSARLRNAGLAGLGFRR
jgi:hypothetical protein